MKGPVIAEWLYAGAARLYGDSDLLVAPGDWDRAVAALEAQGFRDALSPMAHPRMESIASTAFVRGNDTVDLHCTLAGLDGPPEEVWKGFSQDCRTQTVGGRTVRVPARPATLMHVALHASHHGDAEKVVEDLRRALRHGSREEWVQAADLARRLDGLPAFASGLRRLARGAALAHELGVYSESSVRLDLRAAGVPTAEGLHELFASGLSLRTRLSMVLRELFPTADFMRWHTPLARRGTPGLVASYPVRWWWLTTQVPRGLAALLAARRAGDERRSGARER